MASRTLEKSKNSERIQEATQGCEERDFSLQHLKSLQNSVFFI